jgi:hypothetical protein
MSVILSFRQFLLIGDRVLIDLFNLLPALWWTGVFLADKDDKRIAAYLM